MELTKLVCATSTESRQVKLEWIFIGVEE